MGRIAKLGVYGVFGAAMAGVLGFGTVQAVGATEPAAAERACNVGDCMRQCGYYGECYNGRCYCY